MFESILWEMIIISCKMHSFGTMVVNNGSKCGKFQEESFHPRRENRIYLHFEALGATEYVCNIECKIAVDKFRSCTSHTQ